MSPSAARQTGNAANARLSTGPKTPEGKAEPKSETGAETKDEAKAKTPTDLTSKITK